MKYKQVKMITCALTATVMLSTAPLRITAETVVSNVPAAGVGVTLEEGDSLEEVVQNVVESSPAQETANESESYVPATSDDAAGSLSAVGESAIDEKVDASVPPVTDVMSGVGVSQVLNESKAPASPLTAGAGETLATATLTDNHAAEQNSLNKNISAGQQTETVKTGNSDQSTDTSKTKENTAAESENTKESQSSDANTSNTANDNTQNNSSSNSETSAVQSSSEAPSESASESVNGTPSTEESKTEPSSESTGEAATETPAETGTPVETPAETESPTETESAVSPESQVQTEHTSTAAETTVSAEASSGVDLGDNVADFAVQFVGNPYVYGGTSLTNGADCSGFVKSVYENFGISLPHSSTADRNVGSAVGSLEEAQPGDLVCYSGHVAIYIGDGKIVHASTEQTGIKISDADYKSPVAIRRISE